MIRSPQELSDTIKSAVDPKAVLISNVLLALIISLHTALNPESSNIQTVLGVGLGAVIIVLALLRVFDLEQINKHPRVYLALYFAACFIGLVFFTNPSTPYVAAFFLVMFISNLYYGSRGVWATAGLFAAATLAKLAYLGVIETLTRADILNIVAAFLIFVAIAGVYVSIQKVFDWDRARVRSSLKESALEEKRLRALINNMTESVLVLDDKGIIRLYNAAALGLFDTNNSLSDKPLDGIVRFENEKGGSIATRELMPPDAKPLVRDDVSIRYKGNDTAAISIVVTPIRSAFGDEQNEAGFVMTLRDITREKSLEEERDEFISVISHELRTPVTVAEAGISNSLMLAEKMEGNEKIKDSLKTAHDQALYLANMLNDLTTFARAEKGTLEMNLEEFDPRELLDTLKNDYQSAVATKKMSIVSTTDPSTPLRMVSNRLYIREILQNFITNSIKYSDKGTITLSARAKEKGILFSVTDQGIGISTSDLKKVFEKFFRAEDYRTRSSSGTGLGLYITKKLAKILDATFEISSEVGVGSTFSVLVPDKTSALEAKKQESKQHLPTQHIGSITAESKTVVPKPITVNTEPARSPSTLTPLSPSLNRPASAPTTPAPDSTLPKQG